METFGIDPFEAISKYEPMSLRNATATAALIAVLFTAIIWRLEEIRVLCTPPINGTFQLYNPLSRIANGEWLGGDLVFFHGYGTLLAHYPVFKLFGGDISACLVSKRLCSVIAYLMVICACTKAWRIPWQWAAIWTLFHVCAEVFLLNHSLLLPGTSLMGVRTALPVSALPICIILFRRFRLWTNPWVFHATVGLMLGISLFISTEQGMASLAATGMVLLVAPLTESTTFTKRVAYPSIVGVTAIASYVALLRAIIGPDWFEAAKFMLVEIPANQFWYFGGPPNAVPGSISDLSRHADVFAGIACTLIAVLCESVWLRNRRNQPDDRLVSTSVIVLLVSGLISQAGHLAAYSSYHSILARNLGLLGMLWGLRFTLWLPKLRRIPNVRSKLLPVLLPCLTACAGAMILYQKKDATKTMESGQFHGQLPLSPEYAEELRIWRSLGLPYTKVASTYTSLIEDVTQKRFGGPDYIIHALGPMRQRHMDNIRSFDPDFFLTLNPEFTSYEDWVQLRHWDLYLEVIRGYEPVAESPYHVFWKRAKPVRQAQGLKLDIVPTAGGWISSPNPGPPGVFTVSVSYHVTNTWDQVPVLGKLPRFLVKRSAVNPHGVAMVCGNAVSLPPQESFWQFPILLNTGELASLECLTALNITGAKLELGKASMVLASDSPLKIRALVADGKK